MHSTSFGGGPVLGGETRLCAPRCDNRKLLTAVNPVAEQSAAGVIHRKSQLLPCAAIACAMLWATGWPLRMVLDLAEWLRGVA